MRSPQAAGAARHYTPLRPHTRSLALPNAVLDTEIAVYLPALYTNRPATMHSIYSTYLTILYIYIYIFVYVYVYVYMYIINVYVCVNVYRFTMLKYIDTLGIIAAYVFYTACVFMRESVCIARLSALHASAATSVHYAVLDACATRKHIVRRILAYLVAPICRVARKKYALKKNQLSYSL